MFKAEKSKGKEALPGDDIMQRVNQQVDDKLKAVDFYTSKTDAIALKDDIEALVSRGIERDKAFMYVMAEKNPEALLDDQKKAQLSGNTALN
jgi:hypothetical protein